MELIIIRHGQSYVNLGNWQQLDTMDTKLTELGQQQAVALRDWLKEQNPSADALYASTMQRTRETAQYVSEALGLDPIFDDRIREVGNSHHNGNPVKEEALPRAYSNKRINLVLTLSVVGINRLSRSRDEQIVQPIIMINEPIEFMSW